LRPPIIADQQTKELSNSRLTIDDSRTAIYNNYALFVSTAVLKKNPGNCRDF